MKTFLFLCALRCGSQLLSAQEFWFTNKAFMPENKMNQLDRLDETFDILPSFRSHFAPLNGHSRRGFLRLHHAV